MEPKTKSSEIRELFLKLSKTPTPKMAPLYDFLAKLGEALRLPLNTILDTVLQIQQKKLNPEQQEMIHKIYEAAVKMQSLVKDTIHLSRDASLPQSEISVDFTAVEQEELFKALNGVETLIICDENTLKNKLVKQLRELNLKVSFSTIDEGLQTLYASQNTNLFQIAIVCASHYNHHVAYFGRTLKSNLHLSQVMTCLALPNELLTFEKEQAHFDGFSTILNMSKPERLIRKLAKSWRGWATKMSFDYAKPSESKDRILLVEDDPIPQKVTQWQLSEMGYNIDTAPDGHSALKLLEQNVYDLIFMDIGLPDISGLEVTAEIRKREDGKRHTPIIGLTIYALESDQKTGLQAGMDEYLVKPVMPERLKNVLQRWVKNKSINH